MTATPQDIAKDVGQAVVQTAPPVTIWALTLNDWLAVASIIYIALQAVYLLAKWRRETRRRGS